MAGRVRPAADGHDPPAPSPASPFRVLHLRPPGDDPEGKPQPAPGTYVIQVPKEQIFRTPTPETDRRFKQYTRRVGRRRHSRRCRCCLCSLIALLFALVATAGVLYLVFLPRLPRYSVDRVSVVGFNLTSDAPLSPEFDIAVRAENPSGKVRLRYVEGGSVVVALAGVDLCSGVWPAFSQGPRNVTVVGATLTGSGIVLSEAMRGGLAAAQGRREVPVRMRMGLPVKMKFGALTTWKIAVKVQCDLVIDRLAASAGIVSASCGVRIKL